MFCRKAMFPFGSHQVSKAEGEKKVNVWRFLSVSHQINKCWPLRSKFSTHPCVRNKNIHESSLVPILAPGTRKYVKKAVHVIRHHSTRFLFTPHVFLGVYVGMSSLHPSVRYRGTSTIRNVLHKKQSVFGVSRFLIIKKRTPSVLGDFSDFRAKSLKFSDFRANLVIFEHI